jgi:hypothetical protein
MTDDAPAIASQPAGLGGWLWLFGIPLMLWGSATVALLPLLLWQFTPAEMDAARAMAMQHGIPASEFSVIPTDELPWIITVLSGIFVAEAFFSRSSHFRWLATAWLLILCLLRWHDGSLAFPPIVGLYPRSNRLIEAIMGVALAVPILYLWLSWRARNTFSLQASPPRRDGPLHAFLNGPRDWGGGVWCVAGAIMILVCTHTVLIMTHWPYIFPPELTPEIAARLEAPDDPRGNTASALITLSYQQEAGQVPYARMFLALHAAGLLLAIWGLRLFLRRTSLMRWILISSALLLVGANVIDLLERNEIRIPCVQCGHYDGRYDHLAKTLSLFVAVALLLFLPAVRRRFRDRSGCPSG